MKIKLNDFTVIAVLFIVFGCASVICAQKEPMTGGYSKISIKDKNVRQAARFAVKERARTQQTKVNLIEIKNAKKQVVAGVNYELCLLTNYLNKRSRRLVDQFVRIVVYRDLKNKYSLTSWSIENCTER